MQGGTLVKEAGGSRLVSGTGMVFAGLHSNVAIRASMKGTGSWCAVWLRVRSGGGPRGATFYEATVNVQTGTGFIRVLGNNQPDKTLAETRLPPGFSFTTSPTVEARIQGDELTLFVNDRELVRTRDSGIKDAGTCWLTCPPGMLIEKLEYRELGNAGSAAP